MPRELLSVAGLRSEYGLGRDLAAHLIKLLPHIKVGSSGCGDRLLVRRQDLDRLLEKTAREGPALWEIVRSHTPETLDAWLSAERSTN